MKNKYNVRVFDKLFDPYIRGSISSEEYEDKLGFMTEELWEYIENNYYEYLSEEIQNCVDDMVGDYIQNDCEKILEDIKYMEGNDEK